MKKIITFTGASGAGKDSMVDALLLINGLKNKEDVDGIAKSFQNIRVDIPLDIRELVSHTTRKPRLGEENGVAYYFISEDEFKDIKKVEETEYAGNHYCLAEDELKNIKDNGIGLVIVDQNGVECIKNFVDKHKDEYRLCSIFLSITEKESRERMLKRGDKIENVEKRLEQHKRRNEYIPNNEDLYTIIADVRTEADFHYNVIELYNFLRPLNII